MSAPEDPSKPVPEVEAVAAASSTAATYEVHPPQRAAEPVRAAAAAPAERMKAPGPVAVFVSHGMGQQIPFETLDLVSEGLRRQDAVRRGVPIESLPAPSAASVALGDERLARAEL